MFVERWVESGLSSKKEANAVLRDCGYIETDKRNGYWAGTENSAAIISQNVATKQWKIRFGCTV